MPSPNIQIDYDELEKLAQWLRNEAQDVENCVRRINTRVDYLRYGGWIGRGAGAFYEEMDYDILPALKKLIDALYQANQNMYDIYKIFQDAENDAAVLFQRDINNRTSRS